MTPAGDLGGRRVLITRSADDAVRWVVRLAAAGAVPDVLPCVRSERIADDATRHRLVAALSNADGLVVSSVRAVQAVAATAGALRSWDGLHEVVAVGDATGTAVRTLLGTTPIVARGGTARAMAGELLERWGASVRHRRVVVAGAEGGRDDVERLLAGAGAAVTRVDVYRTLPMPPRQHRRDLGDEGVTDVLLASPSAVAGLLNQALVSPGTRLYAIGPTTATAVSDAGLDLAGQAVTPDINGLIAALRRAGPA